MMIPTVSVVDPAATAHTRVACPTRSPQTTVRSLAAGATLGSSCDACRFRASCLGHAFRTARNSTQALVGYRRHLDAGEVLYHAGSKCSLMHVVQAGFFKTIMLSEDGIAQITGFQMPGDLLGMDGLSSGIHRCDAIALTEASVCVVSRARLLQSSVENEALCRHLLGVMGEEILSDHSTMLLLGSRSAEERVAGFIVQLSERLSARGYSGSEIGLWMTREEIGRFLGLELETVSRVLSSLLRRRLIEIHRRHLRIVDLDALRSAVVGHEMRHQRSTSLRHGANVGNEIPV